MAALTSSSLQPARVPDKLRVIGGASLAGSVAIPGAKNAILPLMAACLLTDETCHLSNVPIIEDVEIMAQLLRGLGVRIDFDRQRRQMALTADRITSFEPDPSLVNELRASFLVAGPLLARFGAVSCTHPGGCDLGVRPVNVDIHGFRAMGAAIDVSMGSYSARASKLQGTRIYLDYPSHTGTENLVMAACLASGFTTIVHASREPEVLDLIRFLRTMGADIRGEGTSVIDVRGREHLWGASYRVMPDRLVGGTFAIATAMCGGEVELAQVIPEHLEPVLYKLREVGVETHETNRTVLLRSTGKLRATEVQSMPYPGFPTDNQAEMGTLLTQAQGTSYVVERVFENRFGYVEDLRKMGADIQISGSRAVIQGPYRLRGADLRLRNDLRSGVACVLAALVAEGQTTLHSVRGVHRGFEGLAADLAGLGANIEVLDFAAARVPA